MTSLLQRYNVGPRLAAAFAILIVLSGLVALIGYRGLSSARALIDDIVNQNMVKNSSVQRHDECQFPHRHAAAQLGIANHC